MDGQHNRVGNTRIVNNETRRYAIAREMGADARKQRYRKKKNTYYSRAVAKYRKWYEDNRQEVRYKTHLGAQVAACAAIFALLMGAKALPQSGVQEWVGAVRAVATTELNMGEAIGKLEFVSKFIPESVMVFWNKTEDAPDQLESPFPDGKAGDAQEDGLWFTGSGVVHACAAGEVESVKKSELGGYQVILSHSGGMKSVYEPLVGVRVAPGDQLRSGQSFAVPIQEDGVCKVRINVLKEGEAADIKALMGL